LTRSRFSLSPIVGYHGCDENIAKRVLSGKTRLRASNNDYDWLGPGIYFWADSPERAAHWAREQHKRNASVVKKPAVVGAYIHPGHCLNLTDFGVSEELVAAYNIFSKVSKASGSPLPTNSVVSDGIFLNRRLDCAVIKFVHQLRAANALPPYDTVYGVFEEGAELFPGSGFRQKTHIQIAVINEECFVGGYFGVRI
jgi:hypothetical protein